MVEDVEEMVIAVQNIIKINRKNCRRYALENFNVERMTDGYEAIYRSLLKEKVNNQISKRETIIGSKNYREHIPASLHLKN